MRLAIRKDKPELILDKVSDGYGAPLEFYNVPTDRRERL